MEGLSAGMTFITTPPLSTHCLQADQAGESGSITSQTGAATSTDESNAITGDDESEEV